MGSIHTANDAFDLAIQPVISLFSRDQVAQITDYHLDEQLQSRIEHLAEKANEGELTDAERDEYEGYAQANRFLAVLQATTRRLAESESG